MCPDYIQDSQGKCPDYRKVREKCPDRWFLQSSYHYYCYGLVTTFKGLGPPIQ